MGWNRGRTGSRIVGQEDNSRGVVEERRGSGEGRDDNWERISDFGIGL